jgi:hypothetical protein
MRCTHAIRAGRLTRMRACPTQQHCELAVLACRLTRDGHLAAEVELCREREQHTTRHDPR